MGIKNPFGSNPYGGGSRLPETMGTPPYAGDQMQRQGPIGGSFPMGAGVPDEQKPGLPSAPPSVRSTNPWAKENYRKTLLDIGAAFLSEDDFFQGMGKAASGLSARMDALQKSPNKVEYGGPNNQFEITTDENGNRTVREVPEFAKAIEADRAAKRPTINPKDMIDFRARAISSINRLPPEQRQAAYADLMTNPGKYGIDTTGMPQTYDPTYGTIAGSMGMSVPQYEAGVDRDRAIDMRASTDAWRRQQGEERLKISKSKGGRKGGALRGAPKLPAGFILD